MFAVASDGGNDGRGRCAGPDDDDALAFIVEVFRPGLRMDDLSPEIRNAFPLRGKTLEMAIIALAHPEEAGLHLMLAIDCCSYFEQSVPYEPYEYGMLDVIRTAENGHVTPPDAPGLGVQVDWDAMRAATIHRLDSREIG